MDDLVAIQVAEGTGNNLARAVQQVRRSGAPLTVGELAVDGNDLLGIGIPKGPSLGLTLASLLDEVLEDPALNTRGHLLTRAKEVFSASAEQGR